MELDFKKCTGNREFLYRISKNSTERGKFSHALINWHCEAVPKAVSNSQEFLPILRYDFKFLKLNRRFLHKHKVFSKNRILKPKVKNNPIRVNLNPRVTQCNQLGQRKIK